MEYVSNGSLKDFLFARNDKISVRQRLQWVHEATEALQLLHGADVIHCDVEPRYFLVDANLAEDSLFSLGSTIYFIVTG
ncbi:hypothetical protein B0O99DRAFT_724829 [Bisporella sp. PMI_857]|nr:hypothetical protein B0O99DRAFT_724829 [Bisporella sp. PMI_857]